MAEIDRRLAAMHHICGQKARRKAVNEWLRSHSSYATSVGCVPRRIRGAIVLPPDAPAAVAMVVIELRDVTYADTRAPVVASIALPSVDVRPHARIPFDMPAPEAQAGHQLSLECHVDITGGAALATGDLVTTQSVPVPAGDVSVDVPVSLV